MASPDPEFWVAGWVAPAAGEPPGGPSTAPTIRLARLTPTPRLNPSFTLCKNPGGAAGAWITVGGGSGRLTLGGGGGSLGIDRTAECEEEEREEEARGILDLC